MFKRKHWKIYNLIVPIEKEVIRTDTNGEEITKNISFAVYTFYSLLIPQYLWQAHYQILLIICLKYFIELNGNLTMTIKNVKHVELKISIAIVLKNNQALKMI